MTRPTRYKTLRGEWAKIAWRKVMRNEDGVKLGGTYEPESGDIAIATKRMTPESWGGALLHELHHHCLDTLTLSPRDHYTVDEIIADCTGRGMARLWQMNPELFLFINDCLTGQIKEGSDQ